MKAISVNGQSGTLAIKDDVVTVAWKIEDNIFTIQGQISAEEAIKMAENVKKS